MSETHKTKANETTETQSELERLLVGAMTPPQAEAIFAMHCTPPFLLLSSMTPPQAEAIFAMGKEAVVFALLTLIAQRDKAAKTPREEEEQERNMCLFLKIIDYSLYSGFHEFVSKVQKKSKSL